MRFESWCDSSREDLSIAHMRALEQAMVVYPFCPRPRTCIGPNGVSLLDQALSIPDCSHRNSRIVLNPRFKGAGPDGRRKAGGCFGKSKQNRGRRLEVLRG